MTRSCCPACRLRFDRATATVLASCPVCGAPLDEVADVAELVGYRLADAAPQPEATAAVARTRVDPTR
jgi:predicted amidophosphoribosyltransferase